MSIVQWVLERPMSPPFPRSVQDQVLKVASIQWEEDKFTKISSLECRARGDGNDLQKLLEDKPSSNFHERCGKAREWKRVVLIKPLRRDFLREL